KAMEQDAMAEDYMIDDAELVIAAFGTTARIAKTAIMHLRAEGKKVGLIRPITLFPFPSSHFQNLPASVKHVLDVEMNCGQMVADVKLAVESRCPVSFYGRSGGFAPSVEEIEAECKKLLG
ncbi:MAG: 3-methyl-2-oxobutanoate dehydrogenase subunit beta, partial [Pyramidobacter sp.]|nr:3-methyl-2-oxobutanoate dehydrogenase subunit beta [Pyramidobacter sp.]